MGRAERRLALVQPPVVKWHCLQSVSTLNPASLNVEKTLTATGCRDRSRCFWYRVGEENILTQEVRVVRLGVLADGWPIVVEVWLLIIAIGVCGVRGGSHRLWRSARQTPIEDLNGGSDTYRSWWLPQSRL